MQHTWGGGGKPSTFNKHQRQQNTWDMITSMGMGGTCSQKRKDRDMAEGKMKGERTIKGIKKGTNQRRMAFV